MGRSLSGTARKRPTLPKRHRPGWLQRMDQRSSLARQLHARLLGIADDQGGTEQMSVIARGLAERYVHAEALAVAIEAKAAAGEPFDTGQYLAILDRLARLGQALGLERRARPVPSIREYLASKAAAVEPVTVTDQSGGSDVP